MKLTVFQSDKGDCLLVTSENGAASPTHLLVDGGMRRSYHEHVALSLNELRERGERLERVYVSHIDQDHISGVLQLFDDMKDWRVHEFQRTHGNPGHRPPEAPRPPEVGGVWHNAFHEQVEENAGLIEDMLAAMAGVLAGGDDSRTIAMAQDYQDLATSKGEAVQLSRRIGTSQLRIPLNPEFERQLMCIQEDMPEVIELGRLRLTLLGPAIEDLKELRKDWNKWLQESEKMLRNIQRRAREDERDLLGTEAARLRLLAQEQAAELRELLLAQRRDPQHSELGRRENVTVPNLASLMFLLEEDGKTVLLTGDGHHADILKGLEQRGKLDQHGGKNRHVNVLKVQHHGSEHNLDLPFCQRVTADHYLFCGNGEHENPDLRVVDTILDSRLGGSGKRSPNAEADRPFALWFNSSEAETTRPEAKTHMRKLRKRVERRREESGNRFEAHFLENASMFQVEV